MSNSKNTSIESNHANVKHFLDTARKEDVEAQYNSGIAYYYGDEVKKSIENAVY